MQQADVEDAVALLGAHAELLGHAVREVSDAGRVARVLVLGEVEGAGEVCQQVDAARRAHTHLACTVRRGNRQRAEGLDDGVAVHRVVHSSNAPSGWWG